MVNPDEWDILASQIEDRDGNEITIAEARKRDLKARRDAIRKKEIADAMAAFEAQPEPKKKEEIVAAALLRPDAKVLRVLLLEDAPRGRRRLRQEQDC